MLIPVGERPSKDLAVFMDFLEGVGPHALFGVEDTMLGPRKTLRRLRSKFLSCVNAQRSWGKRRLRAFRRESWAPWLRVSLGFEIDRARVSRARRFPERVPWSDVLYVRRKFNWDPISKRAIHE